MCWTEGVLAGQRGGGIKPVVHTGAGGDCVANQAQSIVAKWTLRNSKQRLIPDYGPGRVPKTERLQKRPWERENTHNKEYEMNHSTSSPAGPKIFAAILRAMVPIWTFGGRTVSQMTNFVAHHFCGGRGGRNSGGGGVRGGTGSHRRVSSQVAERSAAGRPWRPLHGATAKSLPTRRGTKVERGERGLFGACPPQPGEYYGA